MIESKAQITSGFYALVAETSKLNGDYTRNSNFTPTIHLCDSFLQQSSSSKQVSKQINKCNFMSNKYLSSPGCIEYFLACRCWALHTVFEIFHFLMKNEGHWHAHMTVLWINEIMHVRRAGCSQTGVHRDRWDFCEFPPSAFQKQS